MTHTDPAFLGPAVGASAPAKEPATAFEQADLAALSRYFVLLMMRNVTSSGYVIEDPVSPGVFSQPGCVIAAPSYPANTQGVDQDYVFNWVRDGAITAIEIALSDLPPAPGGGVPSLIDYVNFAALCQNNAKSSSAVTLGHACFTVAGAIRPWSEQNDALPFSRSPSLMPSISSMTQRRRWASRSSKQTSPICWTYTRTKRPISGRNMKVIPSLPERFNCGSSAKFPIILSVSG